MDDIRKSAAISTDSTKRVVSNGVVKIKSQVSKAALPTVRQMKRTVQRVKAKCVTEGRKIPQTLAELKIDGVFAQTSNGDNFVLFDNEDEQKRIVIFATKANLKFLLGCVDWYMDGTFSMTPPLFKQIYTIHGNFQS